MLQSRKTAPLNQTIHTNIVVNLFYLLGCDNYNNVVNSVSITYILLVFI